MWWIGREKRAAKGYATRLPPWLVRSFGAKEFYSPGQIRAGIARLNLDPRYADLALATFLPRSEYDALAADQPEAFGYDEAREKFLRWKPISTGDWNPLAIEHSGPVG